MMKRLLKYLPKKSNWKHLLLLTCVPSTVLFAIGVCLNYFRLTTQLQANTFGLLGDFVIIILANLLVNLAIGFGLSIGGVYDQTFEAAPLAMLLVQERQVKLLLRFLLKSFDFIFQLLQAIQLIFQVEGNHLNSYLSPAKLISLPPVPYPLFPISCTLRN